MKTEFIALTAPDLMLASLLVLALIGLAARLRLGVSRTLVIAALRTTAQLLLVGLILEAVFTQAKLSWIVFIMLVMMTVASWEILARQKRKLKGWWGFGVSAFSLFISSFMITMLALFIVIEADPWYTPQYMIPLLGMLLGNTMNGIALGMDRLVQTAWQQRAVIEQRLMLGQKDTEVVLQSPGRIAGMMAFVGGIMLCQILLVVKKKQVERVQAAEMNF